MKKIIDKWFNENYENVLNVTQLHIIRMGKNIDSIGLVSDSYVYVLGKNPTFKDDIERMTYGFIWRELVNWNSKTNRMAVFVEDEIPESLSYNENTDLLLNIDIENFKNTLDRFERIVWEVYYEKGKTRKRELAEHFNFDETSAFFCIRDLKTKFKEYVDTKKGI